MWHQAAAVEEGHGGGQVAKAPAYPGHAGVPPVLRVPVQPVGAGRGTRASHRRHHHQHHGVLSGTPALRGVAPGGAAGLEQRLPGPDVSVVERGVFHGRGTLHAGHCPLGICRHHAGVSVFHHGHGHFHPGAHHGEKCRLS